MRYFIAIFGVVFFGACADEISVKPEIRSIQVSQNELTAMEDSLVVTIGYFDGDGDLGENSPGVKNLVLIDSRNGVEYAYRIPELAPSGSEISIQGNLDVVIQQLVLSSGKTSETFHFSAQITDRSGNTSDWSETENLVLVE